MTIFKDFLNTVDSESIVSVFLVNGVKLKGCVKEHGDDGLLLEYKGLTQFVSAKAIATIMPFAPDGNGC